MEDPEDGTEAEVEGGKDGNNNSLSSYSIDALNKLLHEVLTDEDYERAAEIRDEIERRKAQ